jgi:phosphoglycolate/pyridoxal phosphate phosphatase family enzyme
MVAARNKADTRGGPSPSGGIRLVALDLDGVVWRGAQVLEGAREALHDVLRRGLDLRYVSNNSTAHRETISERLAAADLPAEVERVLTSGFACGTWLRRRLPEGSRVLVIGEKGLLRELREAGLEAYKVSEEAGALTEAVPLTETDAPAAVVVGMDRSFGHRALSTAQTAIRAGALYLATNTDATFPTPEGLLPGAGALVAAISTASQKEPVVVGKPSLALAEALTSVAGVRAEETLFVGDRLETDIAMGNAAKMVTALVLTGVTSEDDLRGSMASGGTARPDHVLNGLGELPALLDAICE